MTYGKLLFAEEMRDNPSPPEALFWEAVRGGQLNCGIRYAKLTGPIRVNRQQVIRGYIADFYLPAFRAIIEVDGDQHLTEKASTADEYRDGRFSDWGYSVLRIRAKLVMADVGLCTEVVEAFAETIAEGAWRGRSSRHWTLTSYGLLRERLYAPAQHRFRWGPGVPSDVEGDWGGEDGDLDAHPQTMCRQFRCSEWALAASRLIA